MMQERQGAMRKRQGDFIPSSSGVPYSQDNKRYRYAPPNLPPPPATLHAVVDCIFGIPSLDNVEVEFRVGKIIADGREGRRFVSAFAEEEFNAVLGAIKKDAKPSCQTDYIFEQARGCNVHFSVNEDNVVTKGVFKERLEVFDMATNLPFDIRIGVARESPITPLPAVVEKDYTKKRAKTRFSLDAKDWVVELTDVITDDNQRSFELEVEVKMSSIKACSDHRACVSLLGSVFVEVHTLLAKIQTRAAQLFPDLKLERIINPANHSYLKREFVQLFPGVNHQDKFPGSLPTGLERSKFKMLQTGKYWVSEKSDGLRLMLFVIGGNAYLVDRKMDFFMIHKFTFLVDLYGKNGVTLMDGEMVRHLHTGKLMYLIFDILALNGRTGLGAYTLLDRLNLVTKQVIEPYRIACKACGMRDDSTRQQFALAGKIFRNKQGIQQLVDFIKVQENGDRLFIDERRCHRNDGLIFTYDGPYLVHSSSHLMKWKYCDRLTIDFRFRMLADDRFVVSIATGRSKEQEMTDFKIFPEHLDRLKSDLAKNANTREAIIECAYDASRCEWEYLNLRSDKNTPNHINTMEHTMRIVTENITLEEILYRVPIQDPSKDCWEKDHPELFKQDSQQSEHSPAVDLPSTPVDSPLAYIPSPSTGQPSSSFSSPSKTTNIMPPLPPTYKPSSQLRRTQQLVVSAPGATPIAPTSLPTFEEGVAFFDTHTLTPLPDSNNHHPFDAAPYTIPIPPLSHNFVAATPSSPPLTLSPPTSPSAFFS